MVNVLDKDKILWYVMRAYKNENTAEDRLSNETYGLEYFIPKQKVLRTVKGKKVFFMVPVIHSLVFVHASHQKIVDFKHNYYYDLQFVTWKSGGELVYLTVPDEDMTNFIKVCKQADEEVHFYKISEINKEKDKISSSSFAGSYNSVDRPACSSLCHKRLHMGRYRFSAISGRKYMAGYYPQSRCDKKKSSAL